MIIETCKRIFGYEACRISNPISSNYSTPNGQWMWKVSVAFSFKRELFNETIITTLSLERHESKLVTDMRRRKLRIFN